MSLEPKTIGLEEIRKDSCEKDENERNTQSALFNSKVLKSISEHCKDYSQISCDIKKFSPDVETTEILNQKYCKDNLCVTYNSYHFNTSAYLNDDTPISSFELGGEYNNQEVQCYRPDETNLGIYGNGSSLEEAIKNTILSCHKKENE